MRSQRWSLQAGRKSSIEKPFNITCAAYERLSEHVYLASSFPEKRKVTFSALSTASSSSATIVDAFCSVTSQVIRRTCGLSSNCGRHSRLIRPPRPHFRSRRQVRPGGPGCGSLSKYVPCPDFV